MCDRAFQLAPLRQEGRIYSSGNHFELKIRLSDIELVSIKNIKEEGDADLIWEKIQQRSSTYTHNVKPVQENSSIIDIYLRTETAPKF